MHLLLRCAIVAAVLRLHVCLGEVANLTLTTFRTGEELDEDDWARRLAEVASGKGFINRVFSEVATGLSAFFAPLNPQPIDRQGIAAVLGPVIAIAITTAVVAAVATAVVNFITDTIASGRGMEPDDWDIDQTAWLEQLHQDLEYSWEDQ